MDQEKYLVACCSRRCSVVLLDYANPTGTQPLHERVVELGEKATSIFYNSFMALFGTVDSAKNLVALYKLEELVYPRSNSVVAEYDYIDYRSSNPVKCKANRHMTYYDVESGTRYF